MDNHEWLNLKQAAAIAGCTRKTLYRYMAKNKLDYRKEANNRRYVQREDIEKLFPFAQTQNSESLKMRADQKTLVTLLERLRAEIAAQSALLEKMIALYQPKTLAELVTKRDQ